MVTECSDCNYKCGTPSSLPFHYEKSLEDKMSNCTFGVQSLSGIYFKLNCPFNEGRSVDRRSPVDPIEKKPELALVLVLY